jgi:hypothetical protein
VPTRNDRQLKKTETTEGIDGSPPFAATSNPWGPMNELARLLRDIKVILVYCARAPVMVTSICKGSVLRHICNWVLDPDLQGARRSGEGQAATRPLQYTNAAVPIAPTVPR